jgi:hypothetical protein
MKNNLINLLKSATISLMLISCTKQTTQPAQNVTNTTVVNGSTVKEYQVSNLFGGSNSNTFSYSFASQISTTSIVTVYITDAGGFTHPLEFNGILSGGTGDVFDLVFSYDTHNVYIQNKTTLSSSISFCNFTIIVTTP